MDVKKIIELLVEGKDPIKEDGINYYSYDWYKLKDIAETLVKKLAIHNVSNSKADEREQAYQKFFRDDPQFRGRSYRLRDNYIWHKDEAYECIDYYLKTGIEP